MRLTPLIVDESPFTDILELVNKNLDMDATADFLSNELFKERFGTGFATESLCGGVLETFCEKATGERSGEAWTGVQVRDASAGLSGNLRWVGHSYSIGILHRGGGPPRAPKDKQDLDALVDEWKKSMARAPDLVKVDAQSYGVLLGRTSRSSPAGRSDLAQPVAAAVGSHPLAVPTESLPAAAQLAVDRAYLN